LGFGVLISFGAYLGLSAGNNTSFYYFTSTFYVFNANPSTIFHVASS